MIRKILKMYSQQGPTTAFPFNDHHNNKDHFQFPFINIFFLLFLHIVKDIFFMQVFGIRIV